MDEDPPALVTVPALLSVLATARVLGCSPMTVYRRIAAGELGAVLEHGRTMIRGDELRAYIDGLERYGPARPRARARRRHDVSWLSE